MLRLILTIVFIMKSSSSLLVVGASEHRSLNCNHTIISNAIKACVEGVERCRSGIPVYLKEEITSSMSTPITASNPTTLRGNAVLIVKCRGHATSPLLSSRVVERLE